MKEQVRCQGKGISCAGEMPGKGHALWTLTQGGQERPCSVSQLKPISWHTLQGTSRAAACGAGAAELQPRRQHSCPGSDSPRKKL